MHAIGIPITLKKQTQNNRQEPDRKSGFFVRVFLRDFLRFIYNYLVIRYLCKF